MKKFFSYQQPFFLARIQRFLNNTYNSQFVRNVAVVVSGTAGAQAITMAFAPFITRLYGPEAFGLQGTYMAIVVVVMPISALSFPIAIVLPREDSEAREIARLSAYIALCMAAICTFVILAADDFLVEVLQLHEIESYLLLIPLVIVFSAWLHINQQWMLRKKQFKISARAGITQAFLTSSAKTGIGFFSPQAAVLIIISTLGYAIHAFILSIGINKVEKNCLKEKGMSRITIKQLIIKYYDFPVFRTPQIFLNAFSQSMPIIVLASFFGPVSAGFYGLGKGLLDMPSQLIGKSVGDVFYSRISEAANRGEKLNDLIFRATLGLAVVSFIPFAVVIFFGPSLFGIVFGSEWFFAGEYARWLSFWMFFSCINKPTIASIPVLGLQNLLLIYEIISLVIRIVALFIGFHILHSDVQAIILFSFTGVIANIFLIFLTILKSKSFRMTH
ncbi:MAG: oligosaccharide flippase family protein [Syntrophotaleaceae bacterium]